MLLMLKTGRVEGYSEGQKPIIYLKSTVQAIVSAGCEFVFSDGQGNKAFTTWYGELSALTEVDWNSVYLDWWNDTPEQPDRQRRKQAEFLVHQECNWSLVEEIGCIDSGVQATVKEVLSQFSSEFQRPVNIKRDWYY